MKKVCAIIILLSIMVAFSSVVLAETEERNSIYPRFVVIVDKEQNKEMNLWIVYCQDKEGNIWAFFDEDTTWETGDLAVLLMWGNMQDEDEILEIYFEGHTDDIDSFLSINGWQ